MKTSTTSQWLRVGAILGPGFSYLLHYTILLDFTNFLLELIASLDSTVVSYLYLAPQLVC